MALELPEAYGIALQMDGVLVGKTIKVAHLNRESASLARQGFIQVVPTNLSGFTVKDISSKGKWIFVHFTGDCYLLLALETGGKILFHKDEQAFTQQVFNHILESRKDTIKSVLMDQATIAGMGLGYAQEVLFGAKIHPKRKATDILDDEKTLLYQTIINTLRTAIQLGGSENEVDLYGIPGKYKKVFGQRKKVPICPVCGTRIEKLVLGSSTYFCPSCQK